jgi:hypothetical protein
LSLRKSAIVLWSGARRPVSHITSIAQSLTFQPAARLEPLRPRFREKETGGAEGLRQSATMVEELECGFPVIQQQLQPKQEG